MGGRSPLTEVVERQWRGSLRSVGTPSAGRLVGWSDPQFTATSVSRDSSSARRLRLSSSHKRHANERPHFKGVALHMCNEDSQVLGWLRESPASRALMANQNRGAQHESFGDLERSVASDHSASDRQLNPQKVLNFSAAAAHRTPRDTLHEYSGRGIYEKAVEQVEAMRRLMKAQAQSDARAMRQDFDDPAWSMDESMLLAGESGAHGVDLSTPSHRPTTPQSVEGRTFGGAQTLPRDVIHRQSSIRLVPGSPTVSRGGKQETPANNVHAAGLSGVLGERDEEAGQWGDEALRATVGVSEEALRKLVQAAHQRDQLLEALQSSLFQPPTSMEAHAATAGGSRGEGPGGTAVDTIRDMISSFGASGSGTGRGRHPEPVDGQQVPSPSHRDWRQRGGAGGADRAGASPLPAVPPALMSEMGKQLEEAVGVAQELKAEYSALQTQLAAERQRVAASRKIAEKAKVAEKELSESLALLTGEHTKLLQRLMSHKQDHANQLGGLRRQASVVARAADHMTETVIRQRNSERRQRMALRAWKHAATDSILTLLAKSALVLKCAAVAHTRSALRGVLRTALLAWHAHTHAAITASSRMHSKLRVRSRVAMSRALRHWRVWAQTHAVYTRRSCALMSLCAQATAARHVAGVFRAWRTTCRALVRPPRAGYTGFVQFAQRLSGFFMARHKGGTVRQTLWGWRSAVTEARAQRRTLFLAQRRRIRAVLADAWARWLECVAVLVCNKAIEARIARHLLAAMRRTARSVLSVWHEKVLGAIWRRRKVGNLLVLQDRRMIVHAWGTWRTRKNRLVHGRRQAARLHFKELRSLLLHIVHGWAALLSSPGHAAGGDGGEPQLDLVVAAPPAEESVHTASSCGALIQEAEKVETMQLREVGVKDEEVWRAACRKRGRDMARQQAAAVAANARAKQRQGAGADGAHGVVGDGEGDQGTLLHSPSRIENFVADVAASAVSSLFPSPIKKSPESEDACRDGTHRGGGSSPTSSTRADRCERDGYERAAAQVESVRRLAQDMHSSASLVRALQSPISHLPGDDTRGARELGDGALARVMRAKVDDAECAAEEARRQRLREVEALLDDKAQLLKEVDTLKQRVADLAAKADADGRGGDEDVRKLMPLYTGEVGKVREELAEERRRREDCEQKMVSEQVRMQRAERLLAQELQRLLEQMEEEREEQERKDRERERARAADSAKNLALVSERVSLLDDLQRLEQQHGVVVEMLDAANAELVCAYACRRCECAYTRISRVHARPHMN